MAQEQQQVIFKDYRIRVSDKSFLIRVRHCFPGQALVIFLDSPPGTQPVDILALGKALVELGERGCESQFAEGENA